jgi:hypothetical protein
MTLDSNEKSNVFISYSRKDQTFVEQLVIALTALGMRTHLDRHQIFGGEDWLGMIGRLILHADSFMFVISPDSVASDICKKELQYAASLHKHLLPILWRETPEDLIPPELQRFNYVPFSIERFGEGLAAVKKGFDYDTNWIRTHTRLSVRASEWNRLGQPLQMLLSGHEIVEARQWQALCPIYLAGPTKVQMDFIKESERELATVRRLSLFGVNIFRGMPRWHRYPGRSS